MLYRIQGKENVREGEAKKSGLIFVEITE